MLRKWKFVGLGVCCVASAISALDASAWAGHVNTPYVPFCNVGHCGGGNYFIPSWRCRDCCGKPYRTGLPLAGHHHAAISRVASKSQIVPAGASAEAGAAKRDRQIVPAQQRAASN